MIALPLGYSLVRLDSVDSTNEEAKRRAVAGAPDGTLVVAVQQKRGKGRRGRDWDSPPGNLYCSLVMRPEGPLHTAMQVGFVIALAVQEAVAARAPAAVPVTCKWPNDLLVGGRKCAGILMEAAGGGGDAPPDWLVAGVGVNVASHPEASEFPATSLQAAGFGGIDVDILLADLIGRFDGWRRRWQREGFAVVREAWLAAAYGRGRPIVVRLHDETFHGTFTDLDRDGALVVDVAAGQRRIMAGDVFFAGY